MLGFVLAQIPCIKILVRLDGMYYVCIETTQCIGQVIYSIVPFIGCIFIIRQMG